MAEVLVRTAAVGVAGLLLGAAGLGAQEGEPRNCRLVLQPATDSTRSVSVEVAPEQYVTHVSGGLRWTCGDARSRADSAVKYDRERRLVMIGAVDYEDALRTLTADTVTYFEIQDRILAEGDVRLLRKSSGATLEGPVVEFYRASGGPVRRTVATGRPRMRVYPDTAARDTADPVVVDADRIELLAGDEARARGDVVIRRPDLDARADSAHFAMQEGTGVLYGSPRVEGEEVTLTGRTIRTTFTDGELEQVLAEEEATATGEGFRLFADRIRGRLRGREIERLWAFGEGLSVALAPPNRLAADSLAFVFSEGRIDTLRAVGSAQAVETGARDTTAVRRALPLGAGERSWVAGDTLVLAFAEDSASGSEVAGEEVPAAADSLGRAGDGRLRSLLSRGDARAYRLLRPQETGGRPARHYQIGDEIRVRFRDGAAHRVEADQAIGVHLDPLPGGGAAASDTAEAARGDTAGAPADTPVAPADSAGAPADTGDAAPPDSTAGGRR